MTSETMALPRFSPEPPPAPASRQPRRSLRGLVVAVIALVVAAGIGSAAVIPSWDGAGAAWTSFLPWTALLLVLLAAIATIRRAWWGLSAVIFASMIWSAVFVPQLIPADVPAGNPDLTVVTQNIGAGNADPQATVQTLAATGAGIVSMQEIAASAENAVAALDSQYLDRAVVGTVGVWSLWSMDEPEPLELGLSWPRALRTVVHHPDGDIAVYAVHLPSVRPRYTDIRDQGMAELATLVAADPAGRVLVLGDLNTATTDPVLDSLTGQLTDSREAVRGGFGFSWPASFPLTRPDHVLTRGLTPVSDSVLDPGGSDHRAILVGLDL